MIFSGTDGHCQRWLKLANVVIVLFVFFYVFCSDYRKLANLMDENNGQQFLDKDIEMCHVSI